MPNQLFDDQNIISILGIQNLPDERKINIVGKVSELVQKRLLARILESLAPHLKEEFLVLLENQNQDVMNNFLDAEVPNLSEMVTEEGGKVKAELQQWSESLD